MVIFLWWQLHFHLIVLPEVSFHMDQHGAGSELCPRDRTQKSLAPPGGPSLLTSSPIGDCCYQDGAAAGIRGRRQVIWHFKIDSVATMWTPHLGAPLSDTLLAQKGLKDRLKTVVVVAAMMMRWLVVRCQLTWANVSWFLLPVHAPSGPKQSHSARVLNTFHALCLAYPLVCTQLTVLCFISRYLTLPKHKSMVLSWNFSIVRNIAVTCTCRPVHGRLSQSGLINCFTIKCSAMGVVYAELCRYVVDYFEKVNQEGSGDRAKSLARQIQRCLSSHTSCTSSSAVPLLCISLD